MNWTVFVTLALYVGIAASAGVSCIDESGSPVDWWIIYKLPNVKNNAASQGGMGYAFMSSKASSLGVSDPILADLTTDHWKEPPHQP